MRQLTATRMSSSLGSEASCSGREVIRLKLACSLTRRLQRPSSWSSNADES